MMNLKNKKIVFFGTPQFTVVFLELFKNVGLDITLVVTGEDKPVGRGQQMHSPAPKIFAEKNNIKYLQPKKLDEEFFNQIKNENFDLFIVIAYGKIIPQIIIDLPKYGTINLHYSLLPKYRGASPVESAILNGETETGITIQQMVFKLDAGNILFQEKINIQEDDTTTILRDKLNQRALEIFPEFLNNLFSSPHAEGGARGGYQQDENLATKCGKFLKDDLDVSQEIKNKDFENLYKKYKAFDKKIFFFKNNLRIKITEMDKENILKLLPESKKDITIKDFENSYGKIFE